MNNIIITKAANGWTVTVNLIPEAKGKEKAPAVPAPRVPGSNVHVFTEYKEVISFLTKLIG